MEGWLFGDPKQYKIDLFVTTSDRIDYNSIKKVFKKRNKEFLLIFKITDKTTKFLNIDGDQELFENIKEIDLNNIIKHYNLNSQCYMVQIKDNELRARVSMMPNDIKNIVLSNV